MSVVDRLVTVFEAVDKFSAKAKDVKKAADDTSKATENSGKKSDEWSTAASILSTRLGTLISKISGLKAILVPAVSVLAGMAYVAGTLATNAFGLVVGAVAGMHTEFSSLMQVGLGAWFLQQTQPAWQAAMAMESYRTSYIAMLGSVEDGFKMMKFVQDYGMKSPFEQGPIRDVVRTLIAAGMDVNRFLPMVESLALFRGPEGYNMTDMAGIIRRLVGGQIADAMGPEGLGRFGINKAMMIQVGAEFDREGRFKGSVTDALAMLERLTTQNPAMKGLRTAFENAYLVRWSNALDAVNRGLETAGMVILEKFLPGLEAGASVIKWMVESGLIERAVGTLADFFGGDNIEDGVVRAMMTVGAFLQVLPGVISSIGNSILDFINNTIAGINRMLEGINKVIGFLKLPMAMIPLMAPLSFAMMGQEAGASVNALVEASMMDYNRWKKEQKDKGMSTAPGVPYQDLNQVFSSGMGGSGDVAAIRNNTGRTAKALEEYKQEMLGGGGLFAKGISPHSLSQRRVSHRRSNKAAVIGAMILELTQEQAEDLYEESLRRQRIGGR